MSLYKYQQIAGAWFILLFFLSVFWYFTLRRLEVILKEHLSATRSHQSISGLGSLFLFVMRGEFKQTGDERLVVVCRRLRQALFGYMGAVAGFIAFLVIFRPHY